MALSNADKISISLKRLPAFSYSIQRLLRITNDESATVDEIAEVLSTDPIICAKVLRLVNSTFYGFCGKITSISRAVVILGSSAIRNLVMGMGVCDSISTVYKNNEAGEFWLHSMSCGSASHALAARFRHPNPEEAFIAGLLHDIGYFVLAVALPEQFQNFKKSDKNHTLELENEFFQTNHVEVGNRLLIQWEMPDTLLHVVNHHHDTSIDPGNDELLLKIVKLSDVLARINGSSYNTGINEQYFWNTLNDYDMTLSDYKKLLADMQQKMAVSKSLLTTIATNSASSPELVDGDNRKTIAVLPNDERKFKLLRINLDVFGYIIKEISSLTEIIMLDNKPNMIILDSENLDESEIFRFASYASGGNIPIAVLADNENELPESVVKSGIKTIDTLVSKREIESLMAERFKSLVV